MGKKFKWQFPDSVKHDKSKEKRKMPKIQTTTDQFPASSKEANERQEAYDKLVKGMEVGQNYKLEPEDGETSRGVMVSVSRAVSRLGLKNIESRSANDVIYVRVLTPDEVAKRDKAEEIRAAKAATPEGIEMRRKREETRAKNKAEAEKAKTSSETSNSNGVQAKQPVAAGGR